MDDWQLLEQYAASKSEEAFRALVDRYAGIVYHTALRQTRDPHAAQDIAQAVFIALSRKAARIPRRTVLCGWLFRATRFAVLNLRRDEACRRRYEQQATMETMCQPNEPESVWEQIAPHLDDALEHLSKPNRDVVMIRFFGNKSHKEVAHTLGVTEDTAKKRLSRALEKLRLIFAKRGAAVPMVALVAAFSAMGAQAAPPGLAACISSTVLAHGGAGTGSTLAIAKATLKLMAWAKAKAALVVGTSLLLAAGGTATLVLTAAGISGTELIGKLEQQSGKHIVWDRRLEIPADLDLKNSTLEQALDKIAVQCGAYWTIDYVVYDSDPALRQLINILQQATDLQAGGWTNLSSHPLQPNVSMVSSDPHGRSRAMIRLADNDDAGNSVAMTVVLSPEASAKFFHPPPSGQPKVTMMEQPGEGPPPGPFRTIRQAMDDGVADGVLAPERLLAQTALASRMSLVAPMPATAETAARLAKDARARWTTIYTLRKSPVEGAGIKLVHSGMQAMYAPPGPPPDPAALAGQMQTNRFGLTPEDRAAHERAVQALKAKKN